MTDEKCPQCGADKMRRGPGFWECRVCTTRVPFDDMLACANEVDRLVDKLLADNARLREAIEAVARGTVEILGGSDCWAWANPESDEVSADFDTAADAALAGLAELGKDKTT
ncbi:MAG TPA: hypothetical protein VM238_15855 [Phycisphaerae bacterium]|nr:hypothetical protein [Phycisphaerae bacterium]